MYLALYYNPHINDSWFHSFRRKYDPYVSILPPHLPLIFPVPEDIGYSGLVEHIRIVLARWQPFDICLTDDFLQDDHWLMLGVSEGNDQVIALHSDLYEGIMAPWLRTDLPYRPHVGLGYFGGRSYDPDKPHAKYGLDLEKYRQAMSDLTSRELKYHRTFNHLQLISLNRDYTKVQLLEIFTL